MSSEELPTEVLAALPPSGRRLIGSVNGQLIFIELPERGKLVVGRGSDCDVVIDDPSISRRHAVLDVGDTLRVEDLGSANGTSVGGRKLTPTSSAVLPAGTALQLGTILLTLQGEEEDEEPAEPIDATIIEDAHMIEVLERVRIAAATSLSVVLLGETGVGKEVFARRVHALSPRSSGQLVRVNCAALVESLLEAELFGYERGAFTGATTAKQGLLEVASGGTLFLDELGELPLSTQAKLLRVVESGEVTRVGAVKPRPVDVRFVSATHRDVKALVTTGRFREDLFFRLDGVSIRIPPLRERQVEIVPLAKSFIVGVAASTGRTPPTLSDDAVQLLLAHRWSGNVRELRNVMQRSVIFCAGSVLTPKDLQFDTLGGGGTGASPAIAPAPSGAGGAAPVEMSADRIAKRERVIDALEKTVWNQTRAAALLGISRRTLQAWLIELNVPRPRAGGR